MITKLLVQYLFAALDFILTHLGTITLPSFFGTGSGSIASLFGNLVTAFESMGNWIPVEIIGPCLVAIVGFVTAAFALKVARVVIAFIPFIGGGGGE